MEDVSYMESGKNTVQESYMFMIDSRNRDRSAHPDAAEYSIEFNSPFRNVCSFALIDATIPRTHYSIDEGSNTLVYSLFFDDNTLEKLELVVPPGDYDMVQLAERMNTLFLGNLRIQPLTTPYYISNKFQFQRGEGQFQFHTESTIFTALGFQPYSVKAQKESLQTVAHTGPYAGSQVKEVEPGEPLTWTFKAQESGRVSGISVNSKGRAKLRVTVGSLQGDITPNRSPVAVLKGTSQTLIKDEETIITIEADTTGSSVYVAMDGTGDLNLCCEITVENDVWALTSPGMVDITGEKLVLVRCPEIETVMFRERFNEKGIHAGLGYVKMLGQGFRDQRSDYFTPFPPRVFHPISKLSKLTIRIENPDGTLYKTRGVDHYLLMLITYYKAIPDRAKGWSPTLLNPAYTPDVHAYMMHHQQKKTSVTSVKTSAQRGANTR